MALREFILDTTNPLEDPELNLYYADALSACDSYLQPCGAVIGRNLEIEIELLQRARGVVNATVPYELLGDCGVSSTFED